MQVCDQIHGEAHIVGSVRRRMPDVGDIEILLNRSAAVRLDVGRDLFPGEWETIKGGRSDWKYWQLRHVQTGHVLDLYRFDHLNRGSQMIIRTGPADFSKRFVSCLRDRGYRHEGGYVRTDDGDKVLVSCSTEVIAFKLAAMECRAPEDRT